MYKVETILNDNEVLHKVNKETGEAKEIKTTKQGNKDVIKINEEEIFTKDFRKAWTLLRSQTTDLEYRVAHHMSLTTSMITNSLEPLSDDMTLRDLAAYFEVSLGKIKSVLDKLFRLGVYGKFECYDAEFKHTKYWVFNPYLGMNGKAVHKITNNLFSNTVYAKL